MKNWFGKKYKWIVAVIIIVIICIACGKEKDEQKRTASVLGVGYTNDDGSNGMQFSNSLIFSVWDDVKEQPDDLAEGDTETVKTDEESPEGNVENSKPDEENKEIEWNVDFDVVREGYIYSEQRNDIDIYYPQLSGLEDSAKEKRINALIEEDVKKIIGEKNKEGDNTLYCISLDYEIKFLNEQIISILYKGFYGYMMPGHGLEAKAITTTIDMEKERVITLKDVVTDFAELSDMLLADEFEHITMWEGTTEGYEASWVLSGYGYADVLEENLGEKYQQWYTDGENFIVIIEDCAADYNEYSISNESVKHILDAEFLKKLEHNVIRAYLTEDIEYVDEVIPAQYTEDLSLLANLKYTNGTYVYQDGKVYYRRYHEDSYEDAALWGRYGIVPDTKKEIVCVDADGVETVLFEDEGYGDIYLIDNRFYMTDGKYSERRLYSVDMQGNDRIDYGQWDIYAVDTERKIFILQMVRNSTSYYIMNYETGEMKQLIYEPIDYFSIDIKDYQDGWIYYEKYERETAVSRLCAVSIEGEQKEIIAITSASESNHYRESILNVEVDADRVYFVFGGYDGSEHVFQRGMLISIQLDGTDYKAITTKDENFYLCHDKGRALVYFSRYYNGEFGRYGIPEGSLVWDVEEDICYCSDFIPDILYNYNIEIGSMWRYCSADMGALFRITTYDDGLMRRQTDVYAIPNDSGKVVRVVMDIEQYITKWEEEEAEADWIKYEDFYFADGMLYFKVEYNAYDRETSIGWRDGYRRLHTDIYRLKIGESKAEVLYSY